MWDVWGEISTAAGRSVSATRFSLRSFIYASIHANELSSFPKSYDIRA